jgi:thymidylate synthase
MQQYLKLLKAIKEKGTYKPAARENMPGTTSLFGYQFRHNLQEGFPLLTTKKMFWKGVVVELLWFLKGDTNIKYLVDNGVNIWNEDAYNYYKKKIGNQEALEFADFIDLIKISNNIKKTGVLGVPNYNFGDCGYQYGKVWRAWGERMNEYSEGNSIHNFKGIDQVKNVIKSLKNNPESRRHIITAIDPAHDNDLALYWCHAMFQFNCRPLSKQEQLQWYNEKLRKNNSVFTDYFTLDMLQDDFFNGDFVFGKVPKYHLDCQLYQRSADVFLGVPFNIASYALLTHIIAKICNMIPGEFIHTFGDVHIYDNHKEAVEEQLTRKPQGLPTLLFKDEFHYAVDNNMDMDTLIKEMQPGWFKIENYNPLPSIKAELSTGIKK